MVWAFVFPGGPPGFIILYRVSYHVATSVRKDADNITTDVLGRICVDVCNAAYSIKPDKDVHHKLLDRLAGKLAEQLGYRKGTALIQPHKTIFKFTVID